MDDLISALTEQTKAINALVESNRELMDLLVGQEQGEQEDAEPGAYLDGSPAR